MGLFSKVLDVGKTGKYRQMATSVASNTLQSALKSVRAFAGTITDRSGVYDSLIISLTSTSDLIHDKFVDQDVINIEVNDMMPVEISEDVAANVTTGILQAAADSEIYNGAKASIIDSEGYVYNLVDGERQELLDGVQCVVSTNLTPVSKEDCLIYIENGKFYFNNLLHSSNFNPSTLPFDTNSGLSCLRAYCLLQYRNMIHTYKEALSTMGIVGYTSIQDALLNFASDHSIDHEDDTILNLCRAIALSAVRPSDGKSCTSSIWSVVHGLMEASAINDAIVTVANALSSGFDTMTAVGNAVREYAVSKYSSVRRFCSGCLNALSTGGIHGLCAYILTYAQSASSMIDDDGVLKFSDNAALTPKEYIAGMVCNIVGIAGVVLGAIISIFAKVLGMVLSAAGTLLLSGVQAIKYDYDNETLAQVVDDDSVLIPAAPFGVFQCEIDMNAELSPILKSLSQSPGVYALEIPGGFVILGPGSYYDSGNIKTIRLECHPSIITKSLAAKSIADYIMSNDIVSFQYDEQEELGVAHGFLNRSKIRQMTDFIMDVWCRFSPDVQYLDNSSDSDYSSLVLSDDDDMRVRNSILVNTGIMHLFLQSLGVNIGSIESSFEGEAVGPGVYMAKQNFYMNENPSFSFLWFIDQTIDLKDGETLKFYFPLGKFRTSITAGDVRDWTALSSLMDSYSSGIIGSYAYRQLLLQSMYIDYCIQLPNKMSWAIRLPRYNRATFWKWVAITTIAAIVVVATVVTLSVSAKRWITTKRAQNQSAVEAAWTSYVETGDKQDYQTYRKAVKKNNRWATFIGGTKYDLSNYWGSTDDSSSSISNPFVNNESVSSEISTERDFESNAMDSETGFNSLRTLITGPILE